jgi:hypothetical protein
MADTVVAIDDDFEWTLRGGRAAGSGRDWPIGMPLAGCGPACGSSGGLRNGSTCAAKLVLSYGVQDAARSAGLPG